MVIHNATPTFTQSDLDHVRYENRRDFDIIANRCREAERQRDVAMLRLNMCKADEIMTVVSLISLFIAGCLVGGAIMWARLAP